MTSQAIDEETQKSEGVEAPATPRHEPLWPAYLAIIAAITLYASLTEKLIFGPPWVAPLLEVALLIPLMIFVPEQYSPKLRWRRIAAIVLIGVINVANIGSLVLLVDTLLFVGKVEGAQLIVEAMKIWLINISVFALWYWELDRGGPMGRWHPQALRYPDFLFPQMDTPEAAPKEWAPTFVDYLYVSFTNSTAFSPTDTLPLTPRVKMLMLLQSLASLLTVALVAARAVNILPQR